MEKELLESIGQMLEAQKREMSEMMDEKLDKKLKPIVERLDKLQADVDGLKEDDAVLKEDVAELKEAHEITRDGVNALLDWSDKISEAQRLPLPKI